MGATRQRGQGRQGIEAHRVRGSQVSAWDGLGPLPRPLLDEYDLEFTHGKTHNQHSAWKNSFQLNRTFADLLRRHRVPVDFNTVRVLKDKPALLGLYLFESYRSYRLQEAKQEGVEISLFSGGELFKQLGSQVDPETHKRKAKQLIKRWHEELCTSYWPECENELSADGERLEVKPGQAVGKGARIRLPGVRKTGAPARPIPAQEAPAPAAERRRTRARPPEDPPEEV